MLVINAFSTLEDRRQAAVRARVPGVSEEALLAGLSAETAAEAATLWGCSKRTARKARSEAAAVK